MTISHVRAKHNVKDTKVKDTRLKGLKSSAEKKKLKNDKKKKREVKISATRLREKEKRANKFNMREERRKQKILKSQTADAQNFAKRIFSWLTVEGCNQIALSTGYLIKPDPKIQPLCFILALSCSLFADGASTFVQIASNMLTWFNTDITPQALSWRVSRKQSVDFLRKIFFKAMEKQLELGFSSKYAKIFQCFTAIQMEDSTSFNLHEHVAEDFKGCGGSASKSAMKLNFVYNITKHVVSSLDIVSGAITDQTLSKNVRKLIKKGELWIRDLGYFSLGDMHIIDSLGAYFLSRLKKGIKVFFENSKQPIDIYKFLAEHTSEGKRFDVDVIIGSGTEKTKVRLVGEKVPEKVREQRIESYKNNRIKRDKNKKMNESYLEWFGYSVFITNAPKSYLSSTEIIIALYKIRWQIELFFLRIKTILELHIIKGETQERVLCFVYAKLISVLFAQSFMSFAASISEEGEELSEYKLLVWLQGKDRLPRVLLGEVTVEDFLNEIIEVYYLLCRNKRKRNSTLELIQVASNTMKAVKAA